MNWLIATLLFALPDLPIVHADEAVMLTGHAVQGGLIVGRTAPETGVTVDGEPVLVDGDGVFLIGIGRDRKAPIAVAMPGAGKSVAVPVSAREFAIERIDGLPPAQVTPPPEVLERIRKESAMVGRARTRRDERRDFDEGFIWPARGRISGVYGSQRILNGQPRRPHFGVDVAAPTGTPVIAPAAGLVTLAQPDLYFSGGTIIIDHGHGLSSSFLHLSEVGVEVGQRVAQGDPIGAIGATGRVTGPHLDWRMNAGRERIDPTLIVSGSPDP